MNGFLAKYNSKCSIMLYNVKKVRDFEKNPCFFKKICYTQSMEVP